MPYGLVKWTIVLRFVRYGRNNKVTILLLLSEKHGCPFVQIKDKTNLEIFGIKSLISEESRWAEVVSDRWVLSRQIIMFVWSNWYHWIRLQITINVDSITSYFFDIVDGSSTWLVFVFKKIFSYYKVNSQRSLNKLSETRWCQLENEHTVSWK